MRFGKHGNYYMVKGKKTQLDFGWESPFVNAMNNARSLVASTTILQEKIQRLDYMISLITDDLCSDVESHFVYVKHGEFFKFFIPSCAIDDIGNEVTSASNDITTVDVSKVNVYTVPREIVKISKLADYFLSSKHIDSTEQSIFYPELNLLYAADDNNHKISIMKHSGQGEVLCKVYYLEKIYPFLSSNGNKWKKKHSLNEDLPVNDFRIPILYELAKWRYELKHNIKF